MIGGTGFDAPDYLYHYTTAYGFAGILDPRTLRATNFSFLNDPSEVQYGKDLAIQILTGARQKVHARERDLIEQILAAFAAKAVSESYVSWFTELSDDLSQWRAYGSSAIERTASGSPHRIWRVPSAHVPAVASRVFFTM